MEHGTTERSTSRHCYILIIRNGDRDADRIEHIDLDRLEASVCLPSSTTVPE